MKEQTKEETKQRALIFYYAMSTPEEQQRQRRVLAAVIRALTGQGTLADVTRADRAGQWAQEN